ncbi:MAG: hypothetical protein MdMp024_0447 [Bacteroidales bacterium]|jgi:hypothetical protein
MSEYKDLIENLARECVDRRFLNKDNDHAEDVFSVMFKHAETSLRIFARNLCNEVANSVGYISSISDFIEKGGMVRILLNEYDPTKASESNLFKRLAYYVLDKKDIRLKRCSIKLHFKNDPDQKDVHFTIADKCGYRIETDIIKRTADVNFNDPTLAKKYADYFDELFQSESSSEIDLITLFHLKDGADK